MTGGDKTVRIVSNIAVGPGLAGGCGDTNGRPQIEKTGHLEKAYRFGKGVYGEQ